MRVILHNRPIGRWFVALLMVGLPWAAWGKDIVIRSGQPVRIATMDFPLFGFATRDAIDLAVEQYGGALLGHRIETQHFGKGCDLFNPNGLKALDNFLHGLAREPKTIGLIGPICSGRTFRIAGVLSFLQIVNISPANTAAFFSDPEVHQDIPYYFRTAPNDLAQGNIGGSFASAPPAQGGLGAATAAIVYYNDEYSLVLKQTFRETFEAAGGTISGEFEVGFGQEDFQAILDSLGTPDVVYAPLFGEEFIRFYLQLRDQHGELPLIGSDGVAGILISEFIGADPVALYVSNLVEIGPLYADFSAIYSARYGESPAAFSAFAYDATHLLLNAVAAVGQVDAKGGLTISTEDVLDYLNDSANYPYAGAGATYQTPSLGDLNPGGWAIFQETAGEFIQVFP